MPQDDSSLSGQYGRLLVAYKKAEDLLHSLGIEAEGVDTAAINELRYAGRHVLNGLNADDEQKQDRELRRAEDHCERAQYEAYDSAIFFHFSSFKRFKCDYRNVPIVETLGDYIKIAETMSDAEVFLRRARSAETDRQKYYRLAGAKYEAVSKASKRLEAAREELNKKVEEHNRLVESEAARRADEAQAKAEAETGRRLAIKVTIGVAVVSAAVQLAIGMLRTIWGG